MPFISLENLQLTVQGIQIALKDVWNSVKNKANRSELVQSDYAQNDDSKLDYVKNRTHYDTRRIETIKYSFDGNLNNREVLYEEQIPIGFVKLSDDIYPPSTWEGGILSIVNEDGIKNDIEITPNIISIYGNPNEEITNYDIGGHVTVNMKDEYIQVTPNIFLSKGTWGFIEMDRDSSNFRSYFASITSAPILTGELKKLDEKYLPSLQSDWNQNDETASDYVQNRTHYIDWEDAQIYTDVTINATWAYTGYETFGLGPMQFKAGETYEVTFDGTVYQVSAQVGISKYNQEITYIGDIVLVGGTVEELSTAQYPFCFNNVKHWVKNGGNHTVSISGPTPIYHQLNEIYIPDSIARTNDLQVAQNEIDTLQTDVSTLQSEVDTLQTDTATLRIDVDNIPANFKKKFNLTDKATGYDYIVEIRDGTLVTRRQPVSAYLASEPTTMHYIHGEAFDPTGMVIMGTYEDGSESELFLDDCSIVPETMDYSNPHVQVYCPDVNENITVDTTVCKKLNSLAVSYNVFDPYYTSPDLIGSTYDSTITYNVTPSDGTSIDYNNVILEVTSSNPDAIVAELSEVDGVPCVTGSIVGTGFSTITTNCRSICGVDHGILCSNEQTFRVVDASTLELPTVSLALSKAADGDIIATIESDINVTPDKYYTDDIHYGVVYLATAKLGSGKVLTLSTPGRYSYSSTSKFPSAGIQTMKRSMSEWYTYGSGVKITWRAFIKTRNPDGSTTYCYSNAISVSYNNLTNAN